MKGSRNNKDSHFFNLFKICSFHLSGTVNTSPGRTLKQNLKLFVAYMCLILVKASNAVFIQHINQL